LKESFGNNPSTPARDTPDFDSAFVIGKMKAFLQGQDNVINKLKTQISHLQQWTGVKALSDEIEACPTSDSILPGIDDADFDPKGDILLLKKLLNDDSSSPLPPKELNFEELKVLKYDVSTDFEDDYYDPEGVIIYLESFLNNDTIPNLPPDVLLDHDPRSLKDEPNNDDLKSIVKVFDPGIHEKIISSTNVRFTFKVRHYFSLTFVVRIFLPYFTYSMDSSFLLSSGSKDTIFDPSISVYSLKPVVSHWSGTIILNSFVEIPSGEIKVHIEVLQVLWGNRLPILDGSLPLSSRLKGGGNNNNKSETDKSLLDHGRLAYRCDSFQKGRGSPGRNKTPGPWSARIPMWELFKGPGGLKLKDSQFVKIGGLGLKTKDTPQVLESSSPYYK
ncbi:hypothetical protein Tco_0403529, partial [Tanacetum coccineum]